MNFETSKNDKALILFYFQLQFYECDRFRWFNMYNSHVLEECDTDLVLENFLTQADSTAVFIDPPFGGRLEPLAYTLDKFDQIRKKHNKSVVSSKYILLFISILCLNQYLIVLLAFQSFWYYLILWNVLSSNVYLGCQCWIIKLTTLIIKNLIVLVSILL